MNPIAMPGRLLTVAFENAPCAIVVTRNRSVMECNEAFCELFGYEKNELLKQLTIKLYPSYEDYMTIGEFRYKELFQRGRCVDERLMKNKMGELFWCETQGNTLTLDSPFDLAVWTFVKISVKEARLNSLSIREQEVSAYIANGYTCKELARQLGISHRTVEGHRAKIMKKLSCRNTAELVSKIIKLDA